MDASDLEYMGQEYAEQYAKYQTLVRGIRALSDTPELLPKSLKFGEISEDKLKLSFVGRGFTIYHESDIPKSTLWSKLMVVVDEPIDGKLVPTVQGFLRIDKGGNVKPDAAMSSQYTVENPKEVLMMMLELGVS